MRNNKKQKESDVLVVVRVRPLNEAETERGEQSVVFCSDKHNMQVSQGVRDQCFSFDAVLGPDSSQDDLFEAGQMNRLIDMATQGMEEDLWYSCTVFAFGQTGSGKTYTITGPHSVFQEGPHGLHSQGLIHRCLSQLLQMCSTGGGAALQASYLEIYNEQVRDLLDPQPHGLLAIRGSRTHGFRVQNPTLVEFCSLDDFNKLLEEGQGKRHTSSHLLNERSSRGHTILSVYITTHTVGRATQGKLSLVDLAGSERVKITGCKAEHLEEAGKINRSLLTLGKCIAALVNAKGRDRHIPYRDSKLTQLMSDSLGGTGRTVMIACVSPTASSLPETLNTLYYSSQARRIKPSPSANRGQREKLVSRLQREIHLLRKENLLLRQHLSSFQEAQRAQLEVKHAGNGNSEAMTIEGAGPKRPGSSPSSEACLQQELNQEKDKLQQDKEELSDCQESPSQQTALFPERKTQLLDTLQDLKRVSENRSVTMPDQTGNHSVISSPVTLPSPRDSAHSRPSSPYCPHHHPPSFLPPIRPPGLLGPCFHGQWHPLLYCICPSSYCPQGLPQWPCELFPHQGRSCITKRQRQEALPPLPALTSDRAARESMRDWPDCRSWETDPATARLRRPKIQSECMGYPDGFKVNSSSQQAMAVGPNPLRSQGRAIPSAPPLPKQLRPQKLLVPGKTVEHAQAM